ncbi:hypothetical protein [Cyanobium sp. La Preciosa 7G6]|uniref:hypothetical protein n=1 Tax=Cyanobium sp. La Preciosa 7G6 TaxID=2823715 RepID=UPI0020CF0951|nr:hypothetical protein [Cyanobium sp. La Preciosa 7G6]MCP9833684.1 hypothetical protein [Cyanobium sp. La Preciosa 7G6]MCP9936558.1 hypothetical protein [Cyanobium sp. Aljojuca 7A6]
MSQSIWLPLLAIDAHDRWQADVKDMAIPQPADPKAAEGTIASLPEAPIKATETSSTSPLDELGVTTGHVLSSASEKIGSLLDAPLSRSLDLSGPSNSSRARPDPGRRPAVALRSTSPARTAKAPAATATFRMEGPSLGTTGLGSANPLLQRNFSNSELLGGVLTIQDLGSPAMPPVARAERARWASSGDPMAPLPKSLREPMRQAIRTLPAPTPTKTAKLQQGRVIYVPSTRVSKPTQVPLAVQADGTVDVLSQTDDPAVIEDIKEWSSRQPAQVPGTVTPTIVNLQPIPAEDSSTPAPAKGSPVATAPIAPPPVPASASASVAPAEQAPAGAGGSLVSPQ